MRPVDLVGLLQETVTLLENRQALLSPHEGKASQDPLKIETAFNLSSAWAYGDGDKLKQIFWNVCQNAVRAMPNGGTVTVSIDDDGDHWRIGFVDDGVGMSAKQMEKVFEPFQSGFEGGTGLGLAIVYQIIEAHEAEIDVRSEQGVGTEIVMRFARAENAMLAKAPGISAGARD
jgi:signal transduction histidine kinase